MDMMPRLRSIPSACEKACRDTAVTSTPCAPPTVLWISAAGSCRPSMTKSAPISLARRSLAWSTSIAAFLCSFYDYHTHGWLKPVFTCATVGMVAGPLLLALSFPTLPRKGEKLWKALLYVLLGAAALT